MLNKLFAKPLSLNIREHAISFDSLAEFEFCLSGRVDVPVRKVAALMKLPNEELKREARTIKAIEKQFVEILRKSVESPGVISDQLRDVDPNVFSQDHDWRQLVLALNEKGPEYDELRRVALVKYMQYLSARQEIIRHTFSLKRGQSRGQEAEAEPLGAQAPQPPARAPGELAGAYGPVNMGSDDTLVLTPEKLQQLDLTPPGFSRLPKGEPVVLATQAGQDIELRLAKHRFVLKVGEPLSLSDEGGTRHTLHSGKNIIGRDTVCNVVVDPSNRDVSRLHLIIECVGEDRLRLTDLSSHGTLLPSTLMEQALPEG